MDMKISINSLRELEKFLSVVNIDKKLNTNDDFCYVEYQEFIEFKETFNKTKDEIAEAIRLIKHDFFEMIKLQNLMIDELRKQVVMPIVGEADINDQSVKGV